MSSAASHPSSLREQRGRARRITRKQMCEKMREVPSMYALANNAARQLREAAETGAASAPEIQQTLRASVGKLAEAQEALWNYIKETDTGSALTQGGRHDSPTFERDVRMNGIMWPALGVVKQHLKAANKPNTAKHELLLAYAGICVVLAQLELSTAQEIRTLYC